MFKFIRYADFARCSFFIYETDKYKIINNIRNEKNKIFLRKDF